VSWNAIHECWIVEGRSHSFLDHLLSRSPPGQGCGVEKNNVGCVALSDAPSALAAGTRAGCGAFKKRTHPTSPLAKSKNLRGHFLRCCPCHRAAPQRMKMAVLSLCPPWQGNRSFEKASTRLLRQGVRTGPTPALRDRYAPPLQTRRFSCRGALPGPMKVIPRPRSRRRTRHFFEDDDEDDFHGSHPCSCGAP